MLLKLLLAVGVIGGILYLLRHVRRQAPEKRMALTVKYGLYLLVLILVILLVTGKIHWVAAGVAVAIAFLVKTSFAIRFLPLIKLWKSARKQSGQSSEKGSGTAEGKMTLKQAMEILGFETVESVEQITKRHRELMQKNHPDRGGSDYLAAQINQAKEILIDHVKKQQ